jgi:hypothetical protein
MKIKKLSKKLGWNFCRNRDQSDFSNFENSKIEKLSEHFDFYIWKKINMRNLPSESSLLGLLTTQ